MKILYFLFLFSVVLQVQAQTQCNNTFSCPAQPATCTYTYNGSWSTSAPSGLNTDESICLLSNYIGNFNFEVKGTIYVAPNVTYSGSMGPFNGGSLIVAGDVTLTSSPNFNGACNIYICATGSLTVNGTISQNASSMVYNAGKVTINGDYNFNTSDLINYEGATFTINAGSASVEYDGFISNCGTIKSITTGLTQINSNAEIYNACSFYVENDLRIDKAYTNNGLIVVEKGTLNLNSGTLTNQGVLDLYTFTIDSRSLIGNSTNSLLVVRNSATLINGGKITGHFYNGPAISVCGACTAGITTVDEVYRNYVNNEEYLSSCGGSICSAPTDYTPPVISCPENIVATGASACTGEITVADPVYSDNCHVSSLTWTMTGATTRASNTSGINVLGTQTFNIGTTTLTYTVTDVHGNSTSCSFTVTVPPLPAFTITKTDVSCFEGNDGKIIVTPGGGSGSYFFSKDNGVTWTSPAQTEDYTFNNLGIGTYTIKIRDTNGCESVCL